MGATGYPGPSKKPLSAMAQIRALMLNEAECRVWLDMMERERLRLIGLRRGQGMGSVHTEAQAFELACKFADRAMIAYRERMAKVAGSGPYR